MQSDSLTPDGFAPTSTDGFEELIGPIYSRAAADGDRTFGFRVAAAHVNGRGSCHGGMLVALADMAWGKPLAAHGYDAG